MKRDVDVSHRLAEFLPYLRRGERQTEFFHEVHDRALLCARCINRARDPNNVAILSEDDLETAVEDAFLLVFAAASVGKLERLTWAYVENAIWFALTPMLRRGWREAEHRNPADPNELDIEDSDGLDVDVKDLIAEAFAEAGLTTQEKEVLCLKFFEGKKWDETAEAMGVTVQRARYRCISAIKKLHDWFARKFGPDWRPWFD